VPESCILKEEIRHICFLFYKLSREKPRDKW